MLPGLDRRTHQHKKGMIIMSSIPVATCARMAYSNTYVRMVRSCVAGNNRRAMFSTS